MNQPQNTWNVLHKKKRFRPRYPSESVVHFMNACFSDDLVERRIIKILDVGCGAGRHLKLFAENGFAVFGGDFSKTGVYEAKKSLDGDGLTAELKVFDFSSLPWENEYFDGLISYGVYYYSDKEGMRSGIDEMFRVLKKGGRGFINLRTTDDFRFSKGEKIENKTFKLTIQETNEFGMTMHFLTQGDVYDYFSSFREVCVEKADLISMNSRLCQSDWLITVVK